MPGTPHELAQLADGEGYPDDFRWLDGTELTPDEWREVLALRAYLAQMRHRKGRDRKGQRRAMRLLRSLLTPEQRRRLRTSKNVLVHTTGGTYRLWPGQGLAEAMERHGKNWYCRTQFCLHDEPDENAMPPADVAIAHLLLLMTDEGEFLRLANATRNRSDLWNGDYLRRMRNRRVMLTEVEEVA